MISSRRGCRAADAHRVAQQIVRRRIVGERLYASVRIGDLELARWGVVSGARGVAGRRIRRVFAKSRSHRLNNHVAARVVGHRLGVAVVISLELYPIAVRIITVGRLRAKWIDLRGDIAAIVVEVTWNRDRAGR